MSHEVLYTSAQQGLKPGSYGFCTVLATDGISKILQDRLESLSGYEHAFALTDQHAHLNPVNFSHLVVSVGSQRFHVLSRVADAGADYSGRSNKLAHHVALAADELTQAGPAWTLATVGFSKTAFDGTPRTIPAGTRPPASSRPFAKCTAWEQAAGDAGWAGVLAETTLKNPSRPVTVIFREGTDVLPLVVEALSLLPGERQWRTTFSTFYTKLPAGIDCQWRFVLDGTPAADATRRNLQFPPIELKSPGRLPFEGPLVEAARSGVPPAATVATTAPAPPSMPTGTVSTRTGMLATIPDPVRVAPVTGGIATHRPPPVSASFLQRHKLWLTVASFAGFFLLAGTTIAIVTRPGKPLDTNARQTETPSSTVANNSHPLPDFLTKPDRTSDTAVATIAPVKPIVVEKPAEDSATQAIPVESPDIAPAVFADIEKRRKLLALPQRDQGVSAADGVQTHKLCQVFAKQPADCELALMTSEYLDKEPRLFLRPDDDSKPGSKSWTVLARRKGSQLVSPEPLPVGRFTLWDNSHDRELHYKWVADARTEDQSSPFGLLFCKLLLRVGAENVQCDLFKAEDHLPEKLNLSQRRQKIALPALPPGSLKSIDTLRVQVELAGKNWISEAKRVPSDAPLHIDIPHDTPFGEGRIQFEFVFEPPTKDRDAAMLYRVYVFPTLLDQGQGPQWDRSTMRIDKVDKVYRLPLDETTMKDGFVRSDFAKLRSWGQVRQSDCANQLAQCIKQIESIQSGMDQASKGLADARKNGRKDREDGYLSTLNDLQAKMGDRQKWKRHWEAGVLYMSKDFNGWIDEVQQNLATIEADFKLRYSVYLDFGSEPVVLTKTIPEPGGTLRGSEVKHKTGDKPAKVESEAPAATSP